MVTTLKDTAKPVTEVPFPALTICASGLHMSNVEAKLTRDFKDWRAENNKNETTKEAISLDAEEFMVEMFQIQPVDSPTEQQITILDILDMMIATNVDASIAVQSVRENALACKKSAQIGEECSDFTYTCSNPKEVPPPGMGRDSKSAIHHNTTISSLPKKYFF